MTYSDQESQRFEKRLREKLIVQRTRLLIQNHLDRLKMVNQGLCRWADIRAGILSTDSDQVTVMIERMKKHRQKVTDLQGVINNTLKGAAGQLEKDLRIHIDRFFGDLQSGIMGKIISHVRSFRIDLKQYCDQAGDAGFNNLVYLIFQEFKKFLDAYIVESINPEVIHFIRQKEQQIESKLLEVASTYNELIADALQDFHHSLNAQLEDAHLPVAQALVVDLDLEGLKISHGIMVGAAEATMRLTAKLKAEAVMRLGLHSLKGWLKKTVRLKPKEVSRQDIQALSNLLETLKQEAERLVLAKFTDYRENIKFKYLLRLMNLSGETLYEGLIQQFAGHVEDLDRLMAYVGQQVTDKKEIYHRALLVKEETASFANDLTELGNQVTFLHDELAVGM